MHHGLEMVDLDMDVLEFVGHRAVVGSQWNGHDLIAIPRLLMQFDRTPISSTWLEGTPRPSAVRNISGEGY